MMANPAVSLTYSVERAARSIAGVALVIAGFFSVKRATVDYVVAAIARFPHGDSGCPSLTYATISATAISASKPTSAIQYTSVVGLISPS
jgi:hypothetical protein